MNTCDFCGYEMADEDTFIRGTFMLCRNCAETEEQIAKETEESKGGKI